ncbi:hypothetical protein VUR80DRAFT_2449 [Thermomyces stellatus]
MESRSDGPAACPRVHVDDHDAQPHDLSGQSPKGLPRDDHRHPMPPLQEALSRAAAVTSVKSDLPTIQSDEDYISSSASSTRTQAEQHDDTSESTSPSDASPPLRPATEMKTPGSGGESTESQAVKNGAAPESVRRLSATGMQHLTASRHSVPVAVVPDGLADQRNGRLSPSELQAIRQSILAPPEMPRGTNGGERTPKMRSHGHPRTLSTPPMPRDRRSSVLTSPRRNSFHPLPDPAGLRSQPHTPVADRVFPQTSGADLPPPALPVVPIPPVSLPTHLQLELAAQKPSPLYIQRPQSVDAPYESSAVKMERLINVVLLTPFLERTLVFGALACLDAWLYTFTILPLRFLLALGILMKWWGHVFAKEALWITGFVWYGLGRLWVRMRSGRRRYEGADGAPAEDDRASQASSFDLQHDHLRTPLRRGSQADGEAKRRVSASRPRPGPSSVFRHKRTKSRPSNLSAFNKADLLQGAIILFSAMALMKLDGSKMYHFIRAQSDIKLYVIFNVLEVGDRLLGAIGQDILECLFSSETLSRNASGRSKVLLPLGMFAMALLYNVVHAVALYYQCITLNVAVNSYSNALLTLLMSNQFVEVKSTVFKRFEKDNLFQLTCADIVERFQLWVMLLIIGLRNVVEVGGLSVAGAGGGRDTGPSSTIPLHSPTILPHSFTVLPTWLLSGEVLSPFLIVIGSEMFVDVIKHAYITKFNNIKPRFYGRILDILCKDYYTNAFTTPSLTRRLGLPVIPLSCLFIRASFQTYHMFLSTRLSPPLPPTTQTSLTEQSIPTSPAVTAALERFDTLIRDALGRSVYGDPLSAHPRRRPWYAWTKDDLVAALTMLVFFFMVFLVLLMVKLVLGMALLHYSRARYASMQAKEREIARGERGREEFDAKGMRKGGWGCVEVGEEKRAWLEVDPDEGLKKRKKEGEGDKKGGDNFEAVSRYEMVAKRIW